MSAPEAVVFVVGDELVDARRNDTVGPALARRLESIGCHVRSRSVLPDNVQAIVSALTQALAAEIDIVLIAGGLGPHEDDRTREAVAQSLGIELELDPKTLHRLEENYRDRGRDVPEGVRRQALRPRDAETLPSPSGTAPGFIVRRQRSLLVALPGAPREADESFTRGVLPLLRRSVAGGQTTATTVLRVAGLLAADVQRALAPVMPNSEAVRVNYLETGGEIELLLSARAQDPDEAQQQLEQVVANFESRLGGHVFARGKQSLTGVLAELLRARAWTLASAESCTGGLIGKRITDLSGASEFYVGGVITYSDEHKVRLLGVAEDTLERCGAVSAEVAASMAQGCRERLRAHVAVSVTGIAGPGGGSADKPVGLVYIGVALPDATRVARHTFGGERDAIRQWSATAALEEVRRALKDMDTLGQRVEPSEPATSLR
ncbi:MAG: CinA family nicotinamide mononucleotide deamidase-related protein [Acidobacteriota bacterium]|nr:MAG: CinA family nicotinamide mononucleotide deamidase-related protein [Acidobacteriota bacterium]